MAIGPEGGFSDAELDMLNSAGFSSLCFGPRILRAETAVIAASAIFQWAIGDLRTSPDA